MNLTIDTLRKGISTHPMQIKKLGKNALSILVGIPTRNPQLDGARWAPDFVWSLLQMNRPTNLNLRYEAEWGGSDIADNRNILTNRAIANNVKYLVLFDDDMILPLNTLIQLIEGLETLPDAAVVSGLICKKEVSGAPEIFKEWQDGRYWDWKENTIEEIWACGAACMAINLDYVCKMRKPYWIDETVLYKNSMTTFTEDLNFCRKIKEEANGKIYVNTNIVCGHLNIKTGEVFFPKSKKTIQQKINSNSSKKAFLIVGVGNSGTSITGKILHERFNVSMGNGFIPAGVEGYTKYEDKDFSILNENVLKGNINLPFFVTQLEELIKTKNEQYEKWGVKDPKLAYLLGLYLSVIKNPIIIRCDRDKELVVKSFMKNYGWDKEKASGIYDDRTMRLDNALNDIDHLIIDFTEFRSDEDIICELNQLF
ncbi:MAG: hypothetical protein ACFFDN_49845 [Candidatus Hodarchaeota archaeon]